MFIALDSSVEILILAIGLAVFAAIAWRVQFCAAALVLFLSPLYIFKVKIGFLPLTVTDLLIFVFGGVWLVKKMSARELGAAVRIVVAAARQNVKFWLPLFLIFFGAALAAGFSADARVSFGVLKSWFLMPLIFCLILLDLIQTKRQFKIIIGAIFFSVSAVALVSAYYLVAGRLTFDGRLSAFYLSPNQLAMYLAPGLILAVFFRFEAKKKWEKILLFAAGCLLSAILYLTYSYGAWLAILAALGYAWIVFWRAPIEATLPAGRDGRFNKRNLYLVSCVLCLVAVFLLLSQKGGAKFVDLLFSDRSSLQSRLMIWRAAWIIIKHNWFLGIGPGMFQDYYLAYQRYFATPYLEWAVPQPHNLFLAFWLQAGLSGLAGFLLLIFYFFKRNRRFWPETKQPLVLALAAVMIYYLAHGLVDTPFWKNDLALIFFTVVFLNYKASRLFC